MATLLAALGRQARAFSEARHAAEQAQLARTDELTGLLNRRGFYDRAAPILAKAPDGNGPPTCALLLLDLNHFKDVNDSLGHATGDELLRRVAARLSASLREEDILARLGGDEFAVLLPHVGAERAVQAAVALIAALEQTVVLDGLHVRTDASIGIALGPEHGRDLGTLLRHADIAMYRAKDGHVRYLIYTPEAADHVTTRAGMELLAQLRHAIEHGDLAVQYQPKVSLRSGEMSGWRHWCAGNTRKRGLLYPDQFLPLARHNRSDARHDRTGRGARPQRRRRLALHGATSCRWRSTCLRPPWLIWICRPAWSDALDRHGLTSSSAGGRDHRGLRAGQPGPGPRRAGRITPPRHHHRDRRFRLAATPH